MHGNFPNESLDQERYSKHVLRVGGIGENLRKNESKLKRFKPRPEFFASNKEVNPAV